MWRQGSTMQGNWAELIILVLVATAECRLLTPPNIFIVGGGSNIIQLGQSTVLQCGVSSTAPQTVIVDWSTTALSANISDQQANVFGGSVNELLSLTNIDSGYCGEYTCTITDSDMIPGSASISIHVAPILEVYLVNQTHLESPGLEVNFTCSINGGVDSSIEILWSGPVDLPETTITESSDGVFTSNLTLTNVTAAFTGIYQCTGRYNNSLCTADVSSNASLVVIAPPIITDQTESPSKVDSGETVALYYEFSSLPSHTDINCIGPDGAVFEETRMDNNTQQSICIDIKISSVNYTHGGEYLCNANNSAGDITAIILLLVRPVVEPQDILAKNGDNVTLLCLVQSFPEPSFLWEMFRDSNDSDTFPDEFGFVSGSGENMMATHPFLDFEPVQYGDAGTYRCMVDINGTWLFSDGVLLAVSPEGSVTVEAVNMTLLYDPNEQATLNCMASGGPNNTFMWFLDGELINEISNTLVLSEVEGGEYTCQVSNAAGSENASIILIEAPHDVMVASNIDLNIASLNDTLMLICKSGGGPNNTFQWEKNGAALDSETSDTLTLRNVNASFGGNYTCTVSNTAGSDSASTILYVAPYIVTPLDEQTLTTNGSNVNISCDVDGFPSPTVSWVDMTNAEVVNMSLLEFSPVVFGDEGLYRCVATVEIDGTGFTAMDDTILVVSPESNVAVSPLNTISSQGSDVTFICSTLGGPNNTFQWEMNGNIIGNDSMLEVMDIDASSGGSYTCTVSNAAGSDSASTTLYVAPYIITPLDEQTFTTNGSNVNISCDVDGFPSPTVSWVDMTNAEVVNMSLLEFSPVMFGDEGLYRCVVTAEINGTNFTVMDDTILVVSPESSVAVSPLNTISSQGSDVTFICSTLGGPNKTFQWEMNGNIIGNDSMLEVMDIDASSGGSYTCTVSNAAGSDSASTTLYVAPYIVTPLDEQTLTTNGSNMNISCDVDGFPSPTVSWVDMTNAEVVNMSLLELSPVMFGDEGLYRCVATAEINGTNFTAMDDTILVVSPESSVDVSPLNTISSQGSDVTFICSTLGGPNNTFQWEMNGNIIGNDSMLEVMDIDASSGGSYTCTVSNAAGSDSASTTLYVAPYIVTPLQEQTLTTNGSNVNISCDADGFPSPTVSWVDMSNIEIVNMSLLEFSPVMFGDEGLYRCVATAEINGININSTDDTILVVSPENSVSASPLNPVFNRGNDIALICSTLGGPNNTFQWKMNGNIVGNDSMLEVMDIDASFGGSYTCTVSNAAGSDSASTTLYVAPYIVTPLEEVTLTFNGSSINLTCEADGFPLPTVSWDRNTTDKVVSDNTLLIIPIITFGQEGVYRCLANVTISGVDYEASDITTVVVSTEGSVMVTPVDQVFTRGENVTLTCISMGGPGNVYQWEKDGEVVVNDSVLTLMDIDASSGGSHTCRVSNLAGNDSATTILYVAPYFVIHPENVETSNSSEVNITCLAESFPDPEYVWIRNGDSDLIRESVVIADVPNSLGFIPVLFGDEGVYTCVASITIGMDIHNESSDTAILTVSPEGSIQVDPTTFNGNDSGNATFNCMALGGPGNMFSWTKVRNNAVVVNDSELMLVDTMASDGGVYQCSVENQAGSEDATVTLNVSPVVTEHPTDQNVTSFEGTIMLSCTATGFPSPIITWFHNNTMEDNTSNITSQMMNVYTTRSTFTVLEPATNDSGMYFCRAFINGYGNSDSNVVTVLVQDIPEQPRNITAVEIQSRYLILTWMEPHDNNAPILGYFVSYNQPAFAGGERVTLNVTEEIVNVTNLLPGVTYNFTVIAYNGIGNSAESESTPLSTLEEAPGNSPQNVTAVSLSSTTINVTWEEVSPIDRNGMITTYEILYEPLETFEQLLPTDIINSTNLFVLLEGLHPFISYNISVRAYTSVGSGPYSDRILETTQEDRPGMPQNVSAVVNSSTEIIVYWEKVPAFNRNGTILLYEVLYRSTLDQTQTLNTTNNSTFTLLLRVEEFVQYNITVQAYTVAGAGEESMPVVVVMTPAVRPGTPAPPMVPVMDEIASSSAVVRWDPIPERFANGEITNYVINYRVSESVNRMKRQTIDGLVVPECIIGGTENTDRNLTVGGNQTNATLRDLTPNVGYAVRILAVNTEGFGEFSNSITFSTNEDVPSEPRNLTVVVISSTSLQLTWERPLCEYGVIVSYTLTYDPVETDGITGEPVSGVNIPPDRTSIQVTNLSINTGYRVSIVAATSAGRGTPANQTGMTDEDAPQAATALHIESAPLTIDSNNVTVTFSWTGPSTRNGSYNYYVTYSGEQVGDYPEERKRNHPEATTVLDGSNISLSITGLPYANYTINVTAFNIITNRSGPSTIHQDRTIIIESSPVINLKAVPTSPESIMATWDLPQYPNGPLSRYIIYYQRSNVITDPPGSSAAGYDTRTVESPTRTINITGLEVFTNYSIFVAVIGITNLTGDVGEGILQRTNASVAVIEPPTSTVQTAAPTVNSFIFDLPRPTITTGPLKLYAVIVVRVTAGFDANRMDYDDIGPYINSDQPYVAAAWSNVQDIPDTFAVGDGSITRVDGVTYTNVRLRSNTEYAALVRVEIVSDNPDMRLISYSPFVMATTDLPYDPVGLGVGLVLVIIILICAAVAVVLVVYFYRTKYYLPRRKGYAANDLELDDSTNVQPLNIIQNPSALVAKPYGHLFEPIPVEDFKEHVKSLHRNDDYPFSEEYSNVEPSHAPTSEATHYPYNASKNRYANISAYDHSRVRLNEIPGRPGSDYINANYIDGYKLEKGFIATQGPVPDSVPDFWRMIWEQDTATIVMVTNLEEKGRVKCHQYWPDEKTSIYGSMRVHIQEILILAEYTVRTFSVTKDDSKDERIVTQYHYTIWPDHGVPEYPTSLLHFVRKVMVSNPPKSGPIVVHCSAGVGRTGTFITLFNQLRRIDSEKNVNVFNFVRSMRRNRCCMVQTESQYIFIHDALLEAIECGVTEVAARDLREQYKRLGAVDEVIGLTGLEIEFDKLDSTIHRRPTNSFGSLQVNKSKNRYANVDMLPYDTSRCRLSFIPGVEGSDYINANYIDGYHKRKAFIATQGPLPDTSDDFWRMVWEQKCATIVMLTKEREGGRVKCHRYWPTTGASNFRQYQVILHAVNEYPDYILREFKIVDTKDGSSLPVKQFQYTGWPEEGVPDVGTGLIDLVGQVQKWQRNSGTHPIVIHCSGGSGRTGTFIAISVLLERLKTEGVVDVFHTGRTLRLQRPGLIQTVDQYEFCYKTVLEYLDSFELYANFK